MAESDKKRRIPDELGNLTLPPDEIDLDELRQVLREHGSEIGTIKRVRTRHAEDN